MSELPDLTSGLYKACLFDMDGVLTNTASVHASAWKRTFDRFLEARAGGSSFVPFDIVHDYQLHVDGKPRNDGVRDFLASRHITLPEGTPADAPGFGTIWSIGNLKNDFLHEVLTEDGVDVYEGSARLVNYLRHRGIQTGVVSSSANTKTVLDVTHMSDLFDVIVDGVAIVERKIPGKPAPDTFLEAARELHRSANETVVFEDALAGVAAGRAGKFGLVVGVDRVGQTEALLQNGADVVVTDLAELLPAEGGS